MELLLNLFTLFQELKMRSLPVPVFARGFRNAVFNVIEPPKHMHFVTMEFVELLLEYKVAARGFYDSCFNAIKSFL